MGILSSFTVYGRCARARGCLPQKTCQVRSEDLSGLGCRRGTGRHDAHGDDVGQRLVNAHVKLYAV